MLQNKAKIISFVPSWTETLLSCELNVVGRTRFCIHPEELVSKIPIVGGTKNLTIDEILKLKPDFVILDKEENKLEMADQLKAHGITLIVSHVISIETAANFLIEISEIFNSTNLFQLAERYQQILNRRSKLKLNRFFDNSIFSSKDVPYLFEQIDLKNLTYVIWKNPYMVIGDNTFISSQFKLFNVELIKHGAEKYPIVIESDLQKYFCLFSSEPYPFEKEIANLQLKNFKMLIINGEKMSWYGIRNLLFLESCFEDA